jgi:glutamyl/glutaminyl-tRNA synthetase
VGNWTYHFAVTVDDFQQQVDLVIRGQDLLSLTGRQIRLARLLGREKPPAYIHHPLIRHPSGAKLSKANRDAGLLECARDLAPNELPNLFASTWRGQ